MKYDANLKATFLAFVLCALTAGITPAFAGETANLMLARAEAASGSGTSEAQACQQAKMNAQMYCNNRADSFGTCSCGSQVVNGQDQWTCQVDAQCGEPTGVVKPQYQ
ncbi:MAG TPA: hypothetical protein VIG89_08915 [Candidatus Acidoferrales bacterium]